MLLAQICMTAILLITSMCPLEGPTDHIGLRYHRSNYELNPNRDRKN